MKRIAAVLTFVLLAGLVLAPFARAAEGESDQWFALYLGDAKSGWVHQSTKKVVEEDRTYWITEVEAHISLARMGQNMTIAQKEWTKEDAAGKVVEMRSSQSMGMGEQVTTGRLEADGKFHLDAMGVKQTVDYPEGALGPAAIERILLTEPLTPGHEYTAKTFSAQSPGSVVTATMKVGEPIVKDVLGRVLVVYPVVTTNDLIPVPQTAFVTEDRELVAMDSAIPGLGTMRMFLTEEAIAKVEGEPAEVFLSTLIAPDRAIADPRKLENAVYRIGKKDGELSSLLEDGYQKVIGNEDGRLQVRVSRAEMPEARFTLPVTDEKHANFLEPNGYLESNDEKVVALAEECLSDETDPVAAAMKIEKYVREKIKNKNLGTGFATAAEVARSLAGDCTEHAVLCAAIARAKGLPSRVAVGVVYLPPGAGGTGETGAFGYHMWTEVMVADGFWLPIDAAIGAWDATHIAFAKSDLSGVNPSLDLTLAVLDVIGGITIEVVEP